MKQMRIFTIGLLLILLAACGGAAVAPNVPPEIRFGEDVCDQCNMIISDERFAAGLVVELEPDSYEHRIFDDIGDLLAYEKAHGEELTVAAYYVHDYNSKEWIDGQAAYYIHSEGLRTPMGFGLAATAQEPEAKALAEEWAGEVLTFAELHERFVAGERSAHRVHHKGH